MEKYLNEFKEKLKLEGKSEHTINSYLISMNEYLMFSIIKRLPASMIPSFMIDWLDLYLTKRINQLKQENVRQAWRNMYLENALDEISNRQQQP